MPYLFGDILIPHIHDIANPLIFSATDENILIDVYMSLSDLVLMFSNVRQWPDTLLSANNFEMAV